MSTSFLQTSVGVGIHSGAGAQRVGMAANQMGNLLNMLNTSILTPEHTVNRVNVGLDRRKKRFGTSAVAGGHAYDYPVHNVAGGGNGQAYPMSKPGYLPGNDGGGTAGYGVEIHSHWTPAGDLTDAQELAFSQADYHSQFVNPEHFHYVDRTGESMTEMFEDMAQDRQRERIKDLLAKGFGEEEVSKLLEREREKKIENAKNHPYNEGALLQAAIARSMPTRQREDFGNTSASPGDVPLKKNLSAYQAATGQGNPLARKKAFQAIRHEQLMSGQVSRVEVATRKVPLSETEILKDIVAASQTQHQERAEHAQKEEREVIDHQQLRAQSEAQQKGAMQAAMARGRAERPRTQGDPQAAAIERESYMLHSEYKKGTERFPEVPSVRSKAPAYNRFGLVGKMSALKEV